MNINNTVSNDTITGSSDADYILNTGSNVTILSGDGDDLVSLDSSGGNVIYAGNGNNTIIGAGSNIITSGGGDNCITVDGGLIIAGNGDNRISLGAVTSVVQVGGGNDVVISNANYNVISDGGGKNSIVSAGEHSTIYTGGGNDTITAGGYYSSIIAGNGHNRVNVTSSYGSSIATGNGDDTIDLTGTTGANVITPGIGNDVIIGMVGGSTIRVPVSVGAAAVGDDAVLSNDFGNITVVGGFDKAINIRVDSSIDTTPSSAEYLIGTAKADVLRAGDDGSTIEGLGGNDKLYGGGGRDIFLRTVGDGNDQIFNYDASDGDVLKINGVDSPIDATYFKESGKKLQLKIGKEKITINDVKDKPVTVDYGSGTFTYNAALADGVTLSGNKKTLTIGEPFSGEINLAADFSSKVKTVDATAVTGDIHIIGNRKANVIYGGAGNSTLEGGGGNDKLYGGNGADVFVYNGGKERIMNYASGVDSILITDGAIDKIKINSKNVVLTIGKGSLTIKNAVDSTVTITDADGETNVYIFNKMRNTLEKARVTTNSQLPSEDYWFEDDFALDASPLEEILDSNDVSMQSDEQRLAPILYATSPNSDRSILERVPLSVADTCPTSSQSM